jgi:hypothetical protein
MTKRESTDVEVTRLDVDLAPAGKSPPKLLEELAAETSEVLRRAPSTGATWIEAKVGQEHYKALDMKAAIVERVQDMDEKRERALLDREERLAKIRREDKFLELQEMETLSRIAEAQRQSKADALVKIATAAKTLQEAGVLVSLNLLQSLGFQPEVIVAAEVLRESTQSIESLEDPQQ